jgi:hypothetical protein
VVVLVVLDERILSSALLVWKQIIFSILVVKSQRIQRVLERRLFGVVEKDVQVSHYVVLCIA